MKEDYLHFLWRMKYLPSRNLVLTNNQEIEILDFGEYNENESGPDFLHGKILIDGVIWFGSIEFHLKSSDWYKHGHQFDSAYDNVILHVVWEDDKMVMVQDRLIPTLILSKYISSLQPSSSEVRKKGKYFLPCVYSLDEVKDLIVEKEKEEILYSRMHRKTKFLQQTEKDGYAQVLYELLATAFGAKVNKVPFWQLSREVPIKRLMKIKQSKRAEVICNASGLILENSGSQKKRGQDNFMNDWQWKRKGLNPKGFPEIRVKQFAEFIQHFDFDFGFLSLPSKEFLKYIYSSFDSKTDQSISYSKPFVDLVISNSFVPFLWWLGEKRGETTWQNKAFEILQSLPAEKNQLTNFLKASGFRIESAYDSQALLELYNQRCSRKKCLSCTIGNDILGK